MANVFISCIDDRERKCVDLVGLAKDNVKNLSINNDDPREPSKEPVATEDIFTTAPQEGHDLIALLKGKFRK